MMNAEDKAAMANPAEARAPRRSFSQQMSAIGARLTQALSMDGREEAETLIGKPDTPTNSESRSVSRGREVFSSGRGGLGNIRQASLSRDRPTDGPDDFSHTRGREPAVHPDRVFSVGRGGAGNIRSPSRGPQVLREAPTITENGSEAEYQARLVREHAEAAAVHSSGRGGAGNISGSRSRSRGPALMHSTGRGGAGNIHAGATLRPEVLDDEERRLHAHTEGIHSTGRGGAANMTSAHGPEVERVTHHLGEFSESTGRGGAGNIHTRSSSRDPGSRASSKEKHGIAAVFGKIVHPHQHTHATPSVNGSTSDVAH